MKIENKALARISIHVIQVRFVYNKQFDVKIYLVIFFSPPIKLSINHII